MTLKVFYLWDFGVRDGIDQEFKTQVKWDIPLLEGYESCFVPNTSRQPGTNHFRGLQNPTLLSTVRQWKPDAVLTLGYNYASIINFVYRWDYSRAPLLFRGDSNVLVKPQRNLMWRAKTALRRKIFSRYSGFLAVGSANREYFRESGVPEDRLFHVPHCVENERFAASEKEARIAAAAWRTELGIPHDHRVILFAGKFAPHKRPLLLMESFQKARLEGVSLLMVGAGDLDAEIRELAASSKNIFVAPFQNQSLMPRTYAAASVQVLPSAAETWGLAVNEGFNLGLPAIVSDTVGCYPDLIMPNETGLVFSTGSVEGLEAALHAAFDDPETLPRWSRNCRDLINQYSYEKANEGLLAALDFAVGDRLRCASST